MSTFYITGLTALCIPQLSRFKPFLAWHRGTGCLVSRLTFLGVSPLQKFQQCWGGTRNQ